MRIPITIWTEVLPKTVIKQLQTEINYRFQLVVCDEVPIGAIGFLQNKNDQLYMVYKQVVA